LLQIEPSEQPKESTEWPDMMSRKSFKLIITALIIIFFAAFPKYLFTALGILLLIVIIVFFIVEFAFDIYIVIAVIAKWFRNK
jgi:hypothetical protein